MEQEFVTKRTFDETNISIDKEFAQVYQRMKKLECELRLEIVQLTELLDTLCESVDRLGIRGE